MRRYWFEHLALPAIGMTILLAIVEGLAIDLQLASYIYQQQTGQWLLKDHWLLQNVLHTGARQTLITLYVALFILWLSRCKVPLISRHQRCLGYLLLTAILSVGIVAGLKQITQIDCPWVIIGLGGELPLYSIYQQRSASLPSVNCFPAGHASAGYAWLGLYFILQKNAPQWRWRVLLLVLLLGLVLGVTQQLRGAHFLSHDLWTLTICWLVAALLSPMLYSTRKTK